MQASRNGLNSWRLIASTLSNVLFLMMVLAISGCDLVGGASSTSQKAESAFQEAVGVPTESGIRLLTQKDRYHREDEVGIWVENESNYALLFRDQSLGLKAYQYEEQKGIWLPVDLGFTVADPHATNVKPGPRSALPSISIPTEWVKATGKIRLVITGRTDRGQLFIAYKDIEIVD
jgi:hypothetical protein